MGLDRGRTRLELIFSEGTLEQFYVHRERQHPRELAAFEEQARWMLDRAR
jgi:hypothetical protein